MFFVVVTCIFLKLKNKKPYLIFGWLWYLGTLVPVIGLVQIGSQPLADRYTYVPLCGIFILLAFLFCDLFKRRKIFYILFSVSIIFILSFISFFQVKHWKNSITLFNHTIAVTEKGDKINLKAHNNLAVVYFAQGNFKESIAHSSIILEHNPNHLEALNDTGVLYTKLGKFKEAQKYFLRALKVKYNDANTHNSFANLLFQSGNFEAAIFHFKEAIRLEPSDASFYSNLGAVYANTGDFAKALEYFKRAYAIEPNDPNLKSNYFRVLQYLKR